MKAKRFLTLLAATALLCALAACGSTQPTGAGSAPPSGTPSESAAPSVPKRTIIIGTFYDTYYFSDHDSIQDDPLITDTETAQMRLDNVRRIEQEYNVEIISRNLTWDGVSESISTSIMAGAPECDIYLSPLQFGIPAIIRGNAVALESFLPDDHDVFAEKTVMTSMNIMGMDETYFFKPMQIDTLATPLAFNMNMINDAGLENPQDLWDRGEWTWDKWREYLNKLTDAENDIYGYGGLWDSLLDNMTMSNGTLLAGSTTETLSAPATIEALDFIYTIYNIDRTARPWDSSDWNVNNSVYADGKLAFWIGGHWIFNQFGGSSLPFEIGCVPWPVGPSGNAETNSMFKVDGSWYFIPRGIENPELVFNAFYEWANWFDGDLTLRDDTEWEENMFMTERNYQYARMMCTREVFDIWKGLGIGSDLDLVPLLNGEVVASQFAEGRKLILQSTLDGFFGG